MSIMTTNLQQLFRHDLWANRLILDASAGLTPDQVDATVVGTYVSLGRTLFHLIASIDSYAARLAVRPRLLVNDDAVAVPSNGHLRAILESAGPELIELAGSTTGVDTVEVMRPDGLIAVPGWIILVQAIDHGREHRTHIATILTQLGIEPPDMDGWTFMNASDQA